MFALTSPLTGGAQTGFTAPTYTLVTDVAPDVFGKQVAISALGGTQVGVTPHSVSSPFTVTAIRPRVFKSLGQVNPTTGQLPGVPKNQWTILVRKGMIPLAGQPPAMGSIRISMDIPAGSDVADPANVRAMISAAVGALNQQSAGLGDSAISGVF